MWSWLDAIVARLATMRLTIHAGAQVRPVGEGIPALGFVVSPTRRRLKRRKGTSSSAAWGVCSANTPQVSGRSP